MFENEYYKLNPSGDNYIHDVNTIFNKSYVEKLRSLYSSMYLFEALDVEHFDKIIYGKYKENYPYRKKDDILVVKIVNKLSENVYHYYYISQNEDDWFSVKVTRSGHNEEWRCDQFDGLLKFLEERLN